MTQFRAEFVAQVSPVTGHTVCLNCRREFTVADARVVTFYAEGEVLGFVCSACVSAEARKLLGTTRA